MASDRRKTRRIAALTLASVLASGTLAACGSNGTSAASGPVAGTVSSGTAAEIVAKYSRSPLTLRLAQTPLKTKPTGKVIDEVEYPGPTAEEFGNAVTAACAALGCTVKRIPMGLTPSSMAAAWNQAVQDHPAAVISAAVTKLMIGSQLARLKAAGVPVVTVLSDATAPADVAAALAGPSVSNFGGGLAADWIAANAQASKTTAHVLAYSYPDLPFMSGWAAAFTSELKRTCPGCDVIMKGYTAASAAQFPSQVVSDLQANPDVNYIAMASGQMMSGVPQVLSAAGLTSKVKIITKAGTNLNFELLKAGTYQQADIGFSMDMYAWGAVDAVARILAGQGNNLPTYDATEILTPSNINFNPATTNSWSIQGYQAMFKKSWGVK